MNTPERSSINRSFKKPLRKKNKFLTILLWIVIISMVGGGAIITGILDYFFEKNNSWVMKINDEFISEKEYKNALTVYQSYIYQIIQELYRYLGKNNEQQIAAYIQQMGLNQNPEIVVKEQLINFALINEQVKKLGISLDQEYVMSKLNNREFISAHLPLIIPTQVLLPDGGINEVLLKQYLKQAAISSKQFENYVESAIKRAVFLQMLMTGAYVSIDELKNMFIVASVPRSYSYVKIDYKKLLAQEKKKAITPEEAKEYFDAHSAHYMIPEKRSGSLVRLNVENWTQADGSKPVISDEMIKAYYEKNKLHEFIAEKPKIKIKRVIIGFEDAEQELLAKEKAENLLLSIKQNPALIDTVEKDAQDVDLPYSVKREVTDYFTRGDKTNKDGLQFEKAAFSLKENGDLSALVQTTNGFEILQLVDKKARVIKPLESVAHEIRATLLNKKFKKNFTHDFMQNMKDQSLTHYADKNHVKVTRLENKVNDQSQEAQKLFSLSLKLNQKGEPLTKHAFVAYFDGDTGVGMQLDEIKPAYLPELSAVLDKVKEDMYTDRAVKALHEMMQAIEKSETKTAFDAKVKELGLAVEKIGDLDPKGKENAAKLEKYFGKLASQDSEGLLSDILALTSLGSFTNYQDPSYGYVIRLDALLEDASVGFEAKNNELRAQAMREEISLLIAGYIDSLRKNVTIKINETLLSIG